MKDDKQEKINTAVKKMLDTEKHYITIGDLYRAEVHLRNFREGYPDTIVMCPKQMEAVKKIMEVFNRE